MERLDHFMARANAAYYATHDPFADFTTAPEISQIFGELLGLWAAIAWRLSGEPSPCVLAEAGPGRGTMMADALRAIRASVPAFADAFAVHLIETSPRLREAQAVRVPDATWHDGLDSLPALPLFLLANEFLDALPIRQFVGTEAGWQERYVADGAFVLRPAESPCAGASGQVGDVVERHEAAADFVVAVARRVSRDGGAALFVDYGPEASAPGDSLQAIRGGVPADPLSWPGAADLTAHVDFQALATQARAAGAAVYGPLPQGAFLERLGLSLRLERLTSGQPPERAISLRRGARRLCEPTAMGRLFKALAITHPAMGVPAGWAA